MASVTAPDSVSDSVPGGVAEEGDASLNDIHDENSNNDTVEECGKLPECVEDSFARLCIDVERVTGLAWYHDRVLNDNRQRRIYVRFMIDPGNMHISTDTFVCTERCLKPVEMIIPVSLTAEFVGTMMVMEIWEAQDGFQSELVGYGREYIHKMIRDNSLEIPLTTKRGKASCGKMFLSAELNGRSGVLSSTKLRGSSLLFDGNGELAIDLIVVVVMECQGLPRDCTPAVVANKSSHDNTLMRTDCADFDNKRGSFVWNHRFCFEVMQVSMEDKRISLSLEDGTENRPLQEAIGNVIIPYEALKNDDATFCAWVPLQPTATTEAQLDVRIRVACCLLKDSAHNSMIPDSLATTELSNASFVDLGRAAETPIALPLGSLLEIKLMTICATTPAEVEFLRELLTSCNEGGGQVAIRGRLQLTGGNSQRYATNAFVRPDKKHCENQVCARLQTGKDYYITLQFELSPDVVTNVQPQLSLEMRSRKSQKWGMSLWIALSFVLKTLSAGVEYQCNLPLIDQEERTCGYLCANFRGGLQAVFQNSDLSWAPVVHKPKTCLLSVKVINLQGIESKTDISCFAKIWSSVTGKSRAQLVSPLMWKKGGIAADEGETKAVSLKVNDAASEILFVGIYRFSTFERNELIGLGSLTIPHALEMDGSLEIQQNVLLFSESPGEKECGSATLTLQTINTKKEEMDSSVSLAATGLGGVAYPVRSGEMKCRFDIDIHKVLCLPVQILEGDTIAVQLRIIQSNWKTELAPAKVVLGGDGVTKYASVGEKTHAVVCWSPKDRAFPVLEVILYVQHQRKPNRSGITSSASLTPNARVRRQNDRQAATHTKEVLKPVLLATGSMNLCSFFSQLNISVRTDLQPVVENASDPTKSESVSLLATLRASSYQEDGVQSPTPLDILDTTPQPVKGDVCIHLLHATGSILRKTSSVSTYYVMIASGTQQVTSSCCSVDEAQTLTWNQQLVLPVACSTPPLMYLTVYHRTVDYSKPENSNLSLRLNGDEVVGYLTLPMFPSVLEDSHLLQLELPFGMPFDAGSVKQNDFHKRGMITLEVQFLPSQQPKTTSFVTTEVFELAIHRVRGNLDGLSSASSPTKHIFIDVSLIVERGGKAEELGVGATGVISLSASGLTEVSEVVDLSNSTVATTLAYDSSCVLVGRIRGLTGNCYGRFHIPLRRDWRERLVNRKKQVWYPICIEENNSDTTVTKDAVLMSLQVAQRNNPAPQANAPGKFYIRVCEVIIDYSLGVENSNLLKLGKYGGASVELTCASVTGSSNETRYRTKQATDQDNIRHWRWTNEWFVFAQTDEPNSPQELQASLRIGAQANQPQFNGRLDLSSTIEHAKLKRLDLWTTLTDQLQNDEAAVTAHLHIVICYIPTIIGEFYLEFGENYTFSESERMLKVEHTFYKCIINEMTYISTIETQEDDPETDDGCKRLQLPFDSTVDTSAALPVFSVLRMGVTKTLGEICLGVLLIDLLSISGLCCLSSSDTSAVNNQERFSWCEFSDKSDGAKTTGVAKLRVRYEFTGNVAQQQNSGTPKTADKRVAAAEVFTIWKKFFYLLDQNGNGYIDRQEFTNIFMNHLDDMVETSDGQKLLQLLFGDNDNQDSTHKSASTPSQQQISVLFSMMDTNRDNEIEWAEYLRFLQHKQQQFLATAKDDDKPLADSSEVPSPQLEQKRELRKKNREDRRLPQLGSSSNQIELSPEGMRELKSKRHFLKQAPSEPKRPSKTSSSEEKLLKLQYSNQEQRRLQQQISSLESILALERRRYAELAADRQALMRSYQQLHLKHQNEIIQEQTKAKWMKQTIERQQQQLEERETLRQNRNQASIVLQSTLRSRLEQKRYQGLKLQRANAAITIQCLIRRVNSKKKLRVLQESNRIVKQCVRAASSLQKFTRFHLHRKERAFLVEARNLSATILQKNARKMIASSTWKRQKIAVLKVQCWFRQRRAIRHVTQIRDATLVVNTFVLGWFMRWQYDKIQNSTRKLQRWWRRTSKERSAFAELLEAVLCIQSAWKRRSARQWFEREWQRQEKFLSELEATICIQAAWRGRHQRRRRRELTPRLDDDSLIEALLYNIIATTESDAVDREISEQSMTNASPADRIEPSLTEMLHEEGSNTEFAALQSENLVTPDDEGVGEEDNIKHILTGLLEAVIRLSEHDTLGSKIDGLDRSNSGSAHVRKLVDLISPSTSTNHVEQDNVSDDSDLNAAGSYEVKLPPKTDDTTANCENLRSEDSELDVIRSVLESIQDQVASRAHGEEVLPAEDVALFVNGIGECQVQDLQQDFSQGERNETQAEAPIHNRVLLVKEESSEDLQEVDTSGDRSLPLLLDEKELECLAAIESSVTPIYSDNYDAVSGSVAKDSGDTSSTLGVKLTAIASDGGVDIPTSITDSGHSLHEPTTSSEEEGALQKPSEGGSGNESESTTKSTDEPVECTVHQQGIDADHHSPPDQHSEDLQGSKALATRTLGVDPGQLDGSNSEGREENSVEVMNNSQHGVDVVSEQEVADVNTASPDPNSDVNGQIPTDADLTAAFDTDTAVGDFAMPNDSDSDDPGNDNNGSDDGADGSSIDSADLMMEADEMAILQDTGAGNNLNVADRATRHRKTERLDSVTLLSDLDQLDKQITENHPPQSGKPSMKPKTVTK